MKIIKGDLIQLAKEGHFDTIVHGCNCFNTMGRGIARNIKKHFPDAYRADQATVKGDRAKLGHYSFGKYTDASMGIDLMVMNAYTQYTYWEDGDLFEYEAFQDILDKIWGIDLSCLALFGSRERWGFPLIGCGLAGGDKDRILGMIESSLAGSDVTVVEYEKAR